MTKEQAAKTFLELVARHGLRWGKDVPRESYEQMRELSKVLGAGEKIQLLRG